MVVGYGHDGEKLVEIEVDTMNRDSLPAVLVRRGVPHGTDRVLNPDSLPATLAKTRSPR